MKKSTKLSWKRIKSTFRTWVEPIVRIADKATIPTKAAVFSSFVEQADQGCFPRHGMCEGTQQQSQSRPVFTVIRRVFVSVIQDSSVAVLYIVL